MFENEKTTSTERKDVEEAILTLAQRVEEFGKRILLATQGSPQQQKQPASVTKQRRTPGRFGIVVGVMGLSALLLAWAIFSAVGLLPTRQVSPRQVVVTPGPTEIQDRAPASTPTPAIPEWARGKPVTTQSFQLAATSQVPPPVTPTPRLIVSAKEFEAKVASVATSCPAADPVKAREMLKDRSVEDVTADLKDSGDCTKRVVGRDIPRPHPTVPRRMSAEDEEKLRELIEKKLGPLPADAIDKSSER